MKMTLLAKWYDLPRPPHVIKLDPLEWCWLQLRTTHQFTQFSTGRAQTIPVSALRLGSWVSCALKNPTKFIGTIYQTWSPTNHALCWGLSDPIFLGWFVTTTKESGRQSARWHRPPHHGADHLRFASGSQHVWYSLSLSCVQPILNVVLSPSTPEIWTLRLSSSVIG